MTNHTSRPLIWTLVVLALVAALLIGAFFALGIPNGLHLAGLLRTAAEAEAFDGTLSLTTDRFGEELHLQTELFRRTSGGDSLLGCSVEPITLFFSGGRLIFDNGRAFDLDGLLPDIAPDPASLAQVLPLLGIRTEDRETGTVYLLSPDPEQLQKHFPELGPDAAFTAEFTEQDGLLTGLHLILSHGGFHTDLTLTRGADRDRPVADAVWNAIHAENVQTIQVFEPLVLALRELSDADPLGAQLAVTADCGPIALTDTMNLYGTDSGLYLERRGSLKPLEHADLSESTLLGLCYQLCRDGKFSRIGSSGTYSMVFPAAQVQDSFTEMLPEIEKLPITYENGSLVVAVEDNSLYEIRLDVAGEMPFLITTVRIALGVSLTPIAPEDVILPQGVS